MISNMSIQYNFCIYLGRFQLPHRSHIATIKTALEQAKVVLIGVGSTNVRTSLYNPFTYQQRVSLLENSHPKIKEAVAKGRIVFFPHQDFKYTDLEWVEHVQLQVKNVIHEYRIQHEIDTNTVISPNPSIALIGCDRDQTTYYLQMFPQWDRIEIVQTETFSATDCRNDYFEFGLDDRRVINRLARFTTDGVIKALKYIPTQQYSNLRDRYFFVQEYQKQWGKGPHYTADPVVIKSGHVLLIKRGQQPDIGAWAFPGGFVNKEEDTLAACLRELQEETGLELKVGHKLTPDWISPDDLPYGLYEKPFRDERGDIRTHAYLFDLGFGELPEVKGGDDAAEAKWVPLADLQPESMFADHWWIMKDLLRKV
jgi:bifunctional NMN adenylyltransferase/nudix hydrolase